MELGAVEFAGLMKGLTPSQRSAFQEQYGAKRKDRGTATVLALLFCDRLWLGDIALGTLKIVTLAGCGIWGLIDLFTAGSRCDAYNRRQAKELVSVLRLNGQAS